MLPSESARASFYSAAAVTLRALDEVTSQSRRLGADPDATWSLFRGGRHGELHDGDRLDLLLRDGSVAHAAAFSPRAVFQLEGLAEDEAFGPEWPGIDPASASKVLRDAASASEADVSAWLQRLCAAWAITPAEVDEKALAAQLNPATRLLVSGAGAIVALTRVLTGRRDLDLGDQAVLFSDVPAERQLFGAAVALLGAPSPARLFPVGASAADLKAAKVSRIDRLVLSDEVSPDLGAKAEALAAELR